MEDKIIDFTTAKLAQSKGFNIGRKVVNYEIDTDKNIAFGLNWDFGKEDIVDYFSLCTPTQSLLQKWLRDEHKIAVELHNVSLRWYCQVFFLTGLLQYHRKQFDKGINYNTTYEESLEVGLYEALKLLPEKE